MSRGAALEVRQRDVAESPSAEAGHSPGVDHSHHGSGVAYDYPGVASLIHGLQHNFFENVILRRSFGDGKTSSEFQAYNSYLSQCGYMRAACKAAAVLSIGGSLSQAHSFIKNCGWDCDSGAVLHDHLADFILIDLPASIIGGGLGKSLVEGLFGTGVEELTGTALARSLGKQGEAMIEGSGNQVMLNIAGQPRRPDILDAGKRLMGEIKNVKQLSYTSQLRDYVAYAQGQGWTLDLYVRGGTYITKPLQEAVDSGAINLHRVLPG